ncbi:hypothetical protein Q1695_016029 [Nippostrongylus brasiliensis]|nr:hypothetical protein Q1695_016029 [Nippostrongylus brasiliensis]
MSGKVYRKNQTSTAQTNREAHSKKDARSYKDGHISAAAILSDSTIWTITNSSIMFIFFALLWSCALVTAAKRRPTTTTTTPKPGCVEAHEDIIKRYHENLSSSGLIWHCNEVKKANQPPPSLRRYGFCKLEVKKHAGINGRELTLEEEQKIVKELLPELGDEKIKKLAQQRNHITTYGCHVSKRTTGYGSPWYSYYYYLTCIYTKPENAYCPRK